LVNVCCSQIESIPIAPRDLAEIEKDIKEVTSEIDELLKEKL